MPPHGPLFFSVHFLGTFSPPPMFSGTLRRRYRLLQIADFHAFFFSSGPKIVPCPPAVTESLDPFFYDPFHVNTVKSPPLPSFPRTRNAVSSFFGTISPVILRIGASSYQGCVAVTTPSFSQAFPLSPPPQSPQGCSPDVKSSITSVFFFLSRLSLSFSLSPLSVQVHFFFPRCLKVPFLVSPADAGTVAIVSLWPGFFSCCFFTPGVAFAIRGRFVNSPLGILTSLSLLAGC